MSGECYSDNAISKMLATTVKKKNIRQCERKSRNTNMNLIQQRKGEILLSCKQSTKTKSISQLPQKSIAVCSPKTSDNVNKSECIMNITDDTLLETIEMLKKQLANAGITPTDEIVTYDDAKSRLKLSLEAAMKDDSFETLQEVEKWDNFIKNHPKYLEEEITKERIWKKEQEEHNRAALVEQMKFVPENIYSGLSVETLVNQGLERKLAVRLIRNRALWLIRKPIKDIELIHISDLKFSYIFSSLDIVELRALYACLPDEFQNDPTNEKREWLHNVTQKLKDMIKEETRGSLSKNQKRHSAYREDSEKASSVYIFRPKTTNVLSFLGELKKKSTVL